MTLTLEIPVELERELASEAAEQGLPLTDYVLHILATGARWSTRPRTGAALVEYWQSEGLIGARPDITDSPLYARVLRERAEQRYSD
jgi:hypothetical protein